MDMYCLFNTTQDPMLPRFVTPRRTDLQDLALLSFLDESVVMMHCCMDLLGPPV